MKDKHLHREAPKMNNNDIHRWSNNIPTDDFGVVDTTSIENIKIVNNTFDVPNNHNIFNKVRNSRNFSSTLHQSDNGSKMNSTGTCIKTNTIEFNTAVTKMGLMSP